MGAVDSLRLLVLGAPGVGKTRFLRKFLMRSPLPGVILDPMEELENIPERYIRITDDASDALSEVLSMEPPNLFVIDEAHRFIERTDRIATNAILKVLDVARNMGLSFILATKHATMLPPSVTTLANFILVNPPRTPSVQAWLQAAGVDVDPEERLSRGKWWIVPVGDEARVIDDEDALDFLLEFLDMTVRAR